MNNYLVFLIIQIYNETIKDLLVPSGPLAMREDGQCGLVVSGLSRHQVSLLVFILRMWHGGNFHRLGLVK